MPREDGTGPRGQGPGTGRGLGRKSGWGRKSGIYNESQGLKDVKAAECALCGKSGEDLSLLLANHRKLGQIMVCHECWVKLYEENRMMPDTSSYREEGEGRGRGRGLGFGRGR